MALSRNIKKSLDNNGDVIYNIDNAKKVRWLKIEEQLQKQQELLNQIAETGYIVLKKFAENYYIYEDEVKESLDELKRKTALVGASAVGKANFTE